MSDMERSAVEWTDAEREALEVIQFGSYRAADDARTDLARLVAAREAQAAAKASVLRGHLDVLRKVLFEDAATDHHMRLRKAYAVIRQAEQMEPFENAYASLRAERDDLRAALARVETRTTFAHTTEWEESPDRPST